MVSALSTNTDIMQPPCSQEINASLAFTSSLLHCLHLSQNPPHIIQDDDSFKVQVLYSLEIPMVPRGLQRAQTCCDPKRNNKSLEHAWSSQPVCVSCLCSCKIWENSVASYWSQVSTQLSHWVFSFHHWADKGYKYFRCDSKWHLHTPACECPRVSTHCSGSMSPSSL